MSDCYNIKPADELIKYLEQQGRNPFLGATYQLPTNYGLVHELKNGMVVFIPNNMNDDGVLFDNKLCFDEIVRNDKFPIENPGEDMFDMEEERIKSFHLQADYYRDYLNDIADS